MSIVEAKIKDNFEGGNENMFVDNHFYTIIQAQPKLAGQILERIKDNFEGGNESIFVYEHLYTIIQAQPELAGQVLDVFKVGLQNPNPMENSFESAYETLFAIAKDKPKLLEQVLDVVKVGLENPKNEKGSLSSAYASLSAIVKSQPELAEQVFDLVKVGLENPKNDVLSLNSAHMVLRHIKVSLSEEEKQNLSLNMKICLNTKRLTKQEFDFAYRNIAQASLVSHGFGHQQRVMNTLIGELEKENNGTGEAGKTFRQNEENCEIYNNNKDWLVPSSFAGASVFGSWFNNYLKKTQNYLSVHDAVFWLSYGLSQEKNESLASFLQNDVIYADHTGKKQARNVTELEIIAKNWKFLSKEEEKLKFSEILAVCRSRKYANQKFNTFAVEAAKWGIAEEVYKNYENIYQSGLDTPTPFATDKEFKFGNLVGRFLPRDDARVGFFGQHTNCCQHFDGIGKECAVSSIKDAYSQLFVIEKEDRIVAGSWIWENEVFEGGKKYKTACFDNIEAIGDYEKSPFLNNIYAQAGKYLTKECDYKKVTIGIGYQDADVGIYNRTDAIALPKYYNNKYSDANTQVLLAENKKATPIDENVESLRFVRPSSFLDVAEMQTFCEQYFPGGDKGLQIPDEPNGFVAIDKYKGVIGYILYNEEEKAIYDMAVLPEYRKDKNVTSSKLMLEIIKTVKKLGGEWSAELREGTSLRYMNALKERGIINLEIGDHVMDDGSKVYSAKFSAKEIEPKTKANTNTYQSVRD